MATPHLTFPRRPLGARLYAPFRREALVRRLRLWLDLWSERRALQRLDKRMLANVGLVPRDVRHEGARAFYDVPHHRS